MKGGIGAGVTKPAAVSASATSGKPARAKILSLGKALHEKIPDLNPHVMTLFELIMHLLLIVFLLGLVSGLGLFFLVGIMGRANVTVATRGDFLLAWGAIVAIMVVAGVAMHRRKNRPLLDDRPSANPELHVSTNQSRYPGDRQAAVFFLFGLFGVFGEMIASTFESMLTYFGVGSGGPDPRQAGGLLYLAFQEDPGILLDLPINPVLPAELRGLFPEEELKKTLTLLKKNGYLDEVEITNSHGKRETYLVPTETARILSRRFQGSERAAES